MEIYPLLSPTNGESEIISVGIFFTSSILTLFQLNSLIASTESHRMSYMIHN